MEIKKALVTGSGGFIGSHLCKFLRQHGVFVVGFSKTPESFSDKSYVGDISDPMAIQNICDGVDVVFHLAGSSSPNAVKNEIGKYFETNVVGTVNILEEAKKSRVKCVIYVSSAFVYGNVSGPVKEDFKTSPDTQYGLVKLLSEDICKYYSGMGLNVVIARLFNAFGKGQENRVIPDLLKKISESEKTIEILGNAADGRDFLSIDQVNSALYLLAQKGKSGQAYNVGSGVSTPILDLARMLLSFYEKKSGVFKKEFKYYYDIPSGRKSCADITKIRKLGFSPIGLNANQISELL